MQTRTQPLPPSLWRAARGAAAWILLLTSVLVTSLISTTASAQNYPATLGNTATASVPAEVTDPAPANNSATDTNTLAAQSALSISKIVLSASPAVAGSVVRYRIQASNAGPSAAIGASVADSVPAQLSAISWTCVASGGGACSVGSGSGNVAVTLNLPVGASATIDVSGTAPLMTPATIGANTVTLTPPTGTTDPDPGDNTATTPPIPVVPHALVAVDDVAGPIDGGPGQANVINVLSNDTLDGVAIVPAQVLLTPANAGPLSIQADGAVNVAAGTPTGVYVAGYQICEVANPGNCDSAQVTVTVNAAATIDALDDAFPARFAGAPAALGNVLGNDTLNGAPVGTLVQLTSSGAGPLLIASDGSATLDPATPAGVYSATYQICETAFPANCDSAVATVRVFAALAANDDNAGPVNASTGAAALIIVLDNDSAGGVTPASLSVVALSGAGTAQIQFNADGSISVPAGTTAGTHSTSYTLCYLAEPTLCDSATVQVNVLAPGTLVLGNDSYVGVDGTTGATAVGNVRANDTLNGVPASSALVSIAPVITGPISIAADGTVSLAANTPAGSYTANYTGCEIALPDHCASATVTVGVATIEARADVLPATRPGALAGNVLGNDFVDGQPANAALVTLTVLAADAGLQIAADGAVSIAAGTASGALNGRYRICQVAFPAICSEADVSASAAAGSVIAADDTLGPANGGSGGVAGNVLGNDTLDGAPAVIGQVSLAPVNTGPISIAGDGSVGVAPATPAGTYTASYILCEVLNPANCDSAVVTVQVSTLAAQDDALGPINGAIGGDAGNVLGNDALDGVPPSATSVVLTPSNNGPITIGADGSVLIAPGTAPGTYTAGYTICSQAAPTICDSATVSVSVVALAALDAQSDVFGPIDGAAGSSNAGNVLANDTLDGAAIVTGSVTLTPSVSLPLAIAADGTVSVAAGTAAGVYTGGYQICEVANPGNCDFASLTVNVRVAAIIEANDDGPLLVDARTGANALVNLLTNDRYNGAVIAAGSVTLSHTASAPISVAADGTVSVAANAAPGTINFSYTICDAADPLTCDSATASVRIVLADALDDAFTVAAAGVAGNVLGNDVIDTGAATPANALVSATLPAPLSLAADGMLTVAANTPAGTYTGSYQLCASAAPTICDSAVVTVSVGSAALDAVDDLLGPINGASGGAAGNVLGNDTLNGAAIAAGSVTLAASNAGPISIAGDGSVSVAAGTAAGSYSAGYTLCEVLNPGNCDSAQVSVRVTTLLANDDALGPVNGSLGGAAGNVLANDRLDDLPIAAGSVSLAPVTAGPISIAADGSVSIAAGTAPGSYTASYTICQLAQPVICDGASVVVSVVANAALDAVNDGYAPVDASTGSTNLGNVLDNDRMDGAALTLAQVLLSPTASAPLSIAADGTVALAPGAAPGVYSGVYQICERANPSNCDSATVSVRATSIIANDDVFAFSTGASGGIAGQVLGNDRLDGGAASVPAIILSGSFAAPLSLEADGRIRVAANTPAGDYTGTYTICVADAPAICDSASVRVSVAQGSVDAIDDLLGPISGAGGGAAGNVLGNDHINGAPASTANALLAPVSSGPISIDASGTVSVAAATPAGTYSAAYTLCEALNPTHCDSASVQVRVTTLIANDDALGPVTGSLGGVAGNVLTNDRLDDLPVSAAAIVLTGNASAPLSLSADGTVNVAPGTAPGSYTASYQICQNALPSLCDSATVSVNVVASAALDAVDDLFGPVDGGSGSANAGNVLGNDRLQGAAIAPATVSLVSSASAPLAVASDGTVSVAAGAAAGLYSASYTICELANPGNCDSATVSVRVVVAASLEANDDGPYLVDGQNGNADAGNVLVNDRYNGASVPAGALTLTTNAPAPVVLTPEGRIVVPAGSAPATYTFTYTICESAQPANCDTANVALRIVVADARNDVFVLADGIAGGNAGNVLGNDLFDGAGASSANVIVQGTLSAPLQLAADGTLGVAPNTPAGVYTGSYRICAQVAPSICDSATVTVSVASAALTISAADDAGSVRGRIGGLAIPSVLFNDRLGGVPPPGSSVTLGLVAPVPHPGLMFDTTVGTITVAAGTPAGDYALVYRICQQQVPGNCAQATARISVLPAQIQANDDSAGPFTGRQARANLLSVLGNDTLDGAGTTLGEVQIQVLSSPAPLQLRDDGQVDLAAMAPAGTYVAQYRLCERANPANCDDASVTVSVGMPPLDAQDDTSAPLPGGTAMADVINVLGNDSFDSGSADLQEVSVTPVEQAPLRLQADGTVDLMTAAAGGSYALTYTICDVINPAHCDSAVARVLVNTTQLAAADDQAQTPQDTPVAIAALANDQFAGAAVDPVRVQLSVSSAPAHGAVSIGNNGVLLYAPTQYFSGADQFQYRACETAAPDNCVAAMVAVQVLANTVTAADDAARTRGQALDIAVLSNDRAAAAPLDAASLQLVSNAQHGQASCAQGQCQYTPTAGYVGADRFVYRICDRSNPTPVCAQAAVNIDVQAAPALLRLSKQAQRRQVKVGDLLRYSLTLQNVGSVDALQVTLVDSLPAGFSLVAGSVSVADADSSGAVAQMQPLRISALDIPIGQTATLSYVLRVGAGVGPGMHINRAIVREDDGTALSNEATAEVEVIGDPLLDDSLILGSVFADDNGNGRQDAGERGLAGVRLGTVEGLLVETDPHGRFHLAGIDGGRWARGRNFLLKVDTATLPAGSRFTTPNPRVLRITPGIPVRFDFGVRVPGTPVGGGQAQITVALGQLMFAGNSAQLPDTHAVLLDDIGQRLRQAGGGSVSITANAGDFVLAFQRADAVRAALDARLDAPLRAATRIELLTQVDAVTALVTFDKDIALGNLLFDTNSAQIRQQYDGLLDALAQRIEQGPDTVVAIVGHADARGPDEVNERLSRRRADAVAQALSLRLSPQRRVQLHVVPRPAVRVSGLDGN